MLDTILKVGASFDYLSPLLAMAQDLLEGPSHTFLVSGGGVTGRDVIRLLRRHGIHTWGHMVVNDTPMVTVRRSQAAFAQYLLDRHGVVVSMPFVKRSPRSPRSPFDVFSVFGREVRGG